MVTTDNVRDPAGVLHSGAVTALAGAAAVHATVIGEHLAEWAPAGWFFLALVVLETFLAIGIWRRPSRLTVWAIASSGLLTVTVWGISRTSGLPLGPPQMRVPEPVGVPDLACVTLELIAGALALCTLRATRRSAAGASDRTHRVTRLALAATLVAITAAGLGLGTPGDHHDHDHVEATHAG
jgi:hypothetical protein